MNYATEFNISQRINKISWNDLVLSNPGSLEFFHNKIMCKILYEPLTDMMLVVFLRIRPDKTEVFEVYALTEFEVEMYNRIGNIRKPMYSLDEEN